MKRKWKALASLCLALALMLCLSLPVWAEGTKIAHTDTASITVSGIKEPADTTVTVSVYRLMDVNVNDDAGQPQDPVYTWVDKVAAWVRTNYSSYIGEAGVSPDQDDNSVQDAFNNAISADDAAAFYDALAAAIRGGQIVLNAADTETVNGTGEEDTGASCIIDTLPMGNYLVLIEGGMKVYRPSAVNLVPTWDGATEAWKLDNATVTLKSSEASITKTVSDTQVAIGDTVTYTLVADLPQFPEKAINKGYQISDILPAGVSLKPDSIEIFGVNQEGEDTKLDSGTNYNLTTTGNPARPQGVTIDTNVTNVDFSITFNNIAALYSDSGYRKIKVTYQADITSSIAVKESENDSLENNTNTAYLDYNNNPYEKPTEGAKPSWKTDSDTATVYTYGIKVTKVDATNTATTLSGAEFTLKPAGEDGAYNKDAQDIKITGSAGAYKRASDQSTGETKLAVDDQGALTISGLDKGTYYLIETKAPNNYVILQDPIQIVIEDDGLLTEDEASRVPDGTTEYKDDSKVEYENNSGYVSLQVENHQGFTLPTTGGMGTVLFTAAGIALMGLGLAALVLYLRRRSDK